MLLSVVVELWGDRNAFCDIANSTFGLRAGFLLGLTLFFGSGALLLEYWQRLCFCFWNPVQIFGEGRSVFKR